MSIRVCSNEYLLPQFATHHPAIYNLSKTIVVDRNWLYALSFDQKATERDEVVEYWKFSEKETDV